MVKQARQNTFDRGSSSYARFRPQYPAKLYEYLASLCTSRNTAWDCGTGSGQCAIALTKYFDRIAATDISQQQIDKAFQHERITYSVQPAERTDFPSDRFDLITVATALHWFDLDLFWQEVGRVIKPGGIFAAWGYGWSRVSDSIDEMVQTLVLEKIKDYWLPQNQLLWDGYEQVDFPFIPFKPPTEFFIEQQWTLQQFFDYLNTWSAMKIYISQQGDREIIAAREKIAELWQKDRVRSVRMDICLKVGQFY